MFASSHLLNFYNRSDVKFTAGEGVYLYCDNGGKYLDFASGIAVNSLGHCPPDVVKILQQQAEKLWHTSNLYAIDGMEEFAKLISEKTFADSVFFANSGAEVLELAIKIIRQYAYQKKPALSKGGDASINSSATNHNDTGNDNKPYRIITFKGCFHGRTNGAIAASGSDRMLSGFHPALPGFDIVPFGDAEAVEQAITEETAGIIIEPIQGEGGINVADFNFLKALRNLCDKHDLVLCYDEVQCGMGRTGTMFAFEHFEIVPDILTLGKAFGGGMPIGAFVASEKIMQSLSSDPPLGHITTFGGHPLPCAAAAAALSILEEEKIIDRVEELGILLESILQHENVIEIRRIGLMLAIDLESPQQVQKVVEKSMENGVLCFWFLSCPASFRVAPPLNISKEDLEKGAHVIRRAFDTL